uniref:Uncharacterized protein n=1 Tax=Rhizophora mucronata TaxID=61149 RepID=A0A2P2Q1C7_RHIMU
MFQICAKLLCPQFLSFLTQQNILKGCIYSFNSKKIMSKTPSM